MKITPSQTARLEFLARVTDKECQHLLDTDTRLFGKLFTIEEAKKIEMDPILAERLDAFVSRFGRLQDTVGDKLLPSLLTALAEKTGPAIDNLDRAEKLGLIESSDGWLEMRRLRNQMVHEYIEDLVVLTSALRSGHAFVSTLVAAARRCVAEANRLLTKNAATSSSKA
ncbi:MAG: nucleotidyltransferase substrate binding protein [Rhodoferax sp.]|nr:nucleotidyltransferase substrate binding protein [Rhodoferax sp.]